jgi:hypothetical protein
MKAIPVGIWVIPLASWSLTFHYKCLCMLIAASSPENMAVSEAQQALIV